MIFRQLFEPLSSTYTYLLGCEETGQAVLIDPVVVAIDRDLAEVGRLGLTLVYPGYSAAWKLLGKALTECANTDEAIEAYRQGLAAAEKKGDKQAAKEMTVFLRRLERPPAR